MSDTPETDAEHQQFAMGGFTLDFCRKLERERNKAREDATNYYSKIGELEQERDEARNLACVYQHQYYMHVHPNAVVPYFSWEKGQNK